MLTAPTDGVVALVMLDTARDADALVLGEDDDIVRWLSHGPGTIETATQHIEECQDDWENDWYRPGAKLGWGIRDTATGTLAGTAEAQFSNPTLEPEDVNLSYSVFPAWRGRGYAARAVELMCSWLADHTDATTAVLRIDPENHRSLAVGRACQFEEIGPQAEPGGGTLLRFERAL